MRSGWWLVLTVEIPFQFRLGGRKSTWNAAGAGPPSRIAGLAFRALAGQSGLWARGALGNASAVYGPEAPLVMPAEKVGKFSQKNNIVK